MTLREKQSKFLFNVSLLIQWAFKNGYELTGGELHRTEEQHQWNLKAGKSKAKRSLHQDRMAIDLNLFKDGKFLTTSEDYKLLGDYWVSLNTDNRWGGDWDKDGDYKDETFHDGNHFEMKL
jgi:hypothetical protein